MWLNNKKVETPKVVNVSSTEPSNNGKNILKRTAKKSTATPTVLAVKPSLTITRRQTALANTKKRNVDSNKFGGKNNFGNGFSETRKPTKKVNGVYSGNRKVAGAVYDEDGIYIGIGIDLCDCLYKSCPGCHFPCPKCESPKCGPECRVGRKFVYDQIEYHGCDLILKNPLNK